MRDLNRADSKKLEERIENLKNELDDMSDAVLQGKVGDATAVGYRARAAQILREFVLLKVDHEITGHFLEATARTAGFPYTPGARKDRVDIGSLEAEVASGASEQRDPADRNLAEAIVAGSSVAQEPATDVATKAV